MFSMKGSSSSGRLSTVSGGSVGETNSVQSEMDDKARSIVSIPLNMNYKYGLHTENFLKCICGNIIVHFADIFKYPHHAFSL